MALTNVVPGQLGLATPFGELLGKSTAEMDAEISDYVKLGVDWVRLDIHWDSVQFSSGGSYDWSKVDKVFNALDAAGIEIVAVINNAPRWLDRTLSTTQSQQVIAEFSAAAAKRYGDKVNYWEFMNEPNKHDIDPADYTAALKATYSAIKAVDADNVVISGGLAAVPNTANGFWGAVDYLKAIYANGGGDYFDAVGYHPYTFPLMPSDSEPWNGWEIMEQGIRSTMVANGDADKQVWMTELGAPTSGGGVTVTEAEQAQILSEAVALSQNYDWAGPIMWFGYQDSPLDTGFGLLDGNGNRKEAYATYLELGNADNTTVPSAPLPTIEELIGTSAGETITGSDDDSFIEGRGGNDRLRGMGGNDTIWGGNGDDLLAGGNGNDRLVGGQGRDVYYGGPGADTFVFTGLGEFDRIMDLNAAEDVIDLSVIDAVNSLGGNQSFNFIGGRYLKNAGDLGVYVDNKYGFTYVQGDVDGDGRYDFNIRLNGVHYLTQDDFVL